MLLKARQSPCSKVIAKASRFFGEVHKNNLPFYFVKLGNSPFGLSSLQGIQAFFIKCLYSLSNLSFLTANLFRNFFQQKNTLLNRFQPTFSEICLAKYFSAERSTILALSLTKALFDFVAFVNLFFSSSVNGLTKIEALVFLRFLPML